MAKRAFAWGGRAVLLAVVALVWVGPYAWMTLTSFRTLPEILAAPAWPLPKSLDLGAYREVFQQTPVARYFLNTVVMAVAIAFVQAALALPAGYALAKLDFAGKKRAFALVVACLLVPAQVTFVPVFLLLGRVGLVNTMGALVLPFAVSALGTFLFRQAISQVPDEIIEAARMDGASELAIVFRILAPIVKPTIVSFFLFSFITHYCDYFWPLVMTTDEASRTLPVGVALLREQGTGARWHVIMAGNVLLSAPVLALFAFTQRHIVRAVSRGVPTR